MKNGMIWDPANPLLIDSFGTFDYAYHPYSVQDPIIDESPFSNFEVLSDVNIHLDKSVTFNPEFSFPELLAEPFPFFDNELGSSLEVPYN